jgi:hypothetical protein
MAGFGVSGVEPSFFLLSEIECISDHCEIKDSLQNDDYSCCM